MATLNTSTNGQSIRSSYEKIVNGPAQSWAVFTVQAPLVSAFQQDSGMQ